RKGRLADAEMLCRQQLAADPGNGAALACLLDILRSAGRIDAAVAACDELIAQCPELPALRRARGNLLLALGRCADALADYDAALAAEPGDAVCWNNRGAALKKLHRLDEALASFERAAEIDRDFTEAHYNRGDLLLQLWRYEEAIAACDRALASDPRYARAHYDRGLALQALSRFSEARDSFERARKLAPDMPWLPGQLLHCRQKLCDWHGLEQLYREIARGIEQGRPVCAPFYDLPTPLDLSQQKRCAELYVSEILPAAGRPLSPTRARRRIHVGYFSADFHDHPVAQLLAGVLESHSRRFRVTAFSFGPDSDAPLRRRIVSAVHRFAEVRDLSDNEIAQLARESGIDIAVDLMGHTQNSRPGIFAMRAAPVQVNYLGYPGTMGASWMDYIIADRVVLPAEHRPHYSEKVAWLPDSFFPGGGERAIEPGDADRASLGLPEDGFVFACFNNPYKLNPADFELWMSLLRDVPGSVLWLAGATTAVMDRLRDEAEKHGVDAERLVFKQRTPTVAEHLGQLRHADLFLDTRYYNGHVTTSDALLAGLPVLTMRGETFAGRVAASQLQAAGLPELVAGTADQYRERALALATDAGALAGLRERLSSARRNSPYFDLERYTRSLEAAFQAMHTGAVDGQPARHLEDLQPSAPSGFWRRLLGATK
ncbi:MAG: tetratricopeptide repeat protein, partial [Gammaproteobacteria bacterium]